MKCRMNHNMRHSCVGKAKNNIFHIVLVVILGISSFGCLRDQDEVYKDPYVNPEAKVGQQVSEQVEPADWPFGMKARDGAAWYERPVICVWNNGYSNDGGNGCHSSYCSKIYSLPDGRELDMVDFFSADKLKDLSSFVTKRLCRELLEPKEAEEMSKYPLDLDEAYMLVSMDGVKWTWDPYSILPGCYGTPSVFIKWNELGDFK